MQAPIYKGTSKGTPDTRDQRPETRDQRPDTSFLPDTRYQILYQKPDTVQVYQNRIQSGLRRSWEMTLDAAV